MTAQLGHGWRTARLGDLVDHHKEQIAPFASPERAYAHYSIPAFDDGLRPVIEPGSSILSHKLTVPSDAVLVSRLNPRILRVWSPKALRTDAEAICSTEFLVVRPHSVDRRFLHYLCMAPQFRRSLLARVTGTSGSHQRVPPASALKIEIQLPPPKSQRAIATVLDTLDDKIELNRHMNKTLEAMAQALFKSWFVDFDPVRAKMAGRATGLPQEIATLFSTKVVHTESGDIPVGWRTYRLAELAEHHTDTTSPSAMPDSVFGHFSIPAYDNGQSPSPELGATIKCNKTLMPHGAILLSKLNPEIPRVWLPQSVDMPQICSTEFLAFTPSAPASRSLLFSLFCDHAFRTVLCSLVTGTSRSHQRVPPKALKSTSVIAGRPEVFFAFDMLATPWLDRVIVNRAESQILSQVRDALLPRLVSGEMRVQQAEEVVGHVL